jgi:hypothetical protein
MSDEIRIWEVAAPAPADHSANGSRRAVEARSWPREQERMLRGLGECNEQLDALMVRLFYLARALAAAQVTIASGMERVKRCAACGKQTPATLPIRHGPMCLAAEINFVVERLAETLDANTQRKENA